MAKNQNEVKEFNFAEYYKNLSPAEKAKVNAEIQTHEKEQAEFFKENFNLVFPKGMNFFIENGIPVSEVQRQACETILGSKTTLNAGAFVSLGKALYQAGLKAHKSYEKIGDDVVFFQYRVKSKKTRKAKADVKK